MIKWEHQRLYASNSAALLEHVNKAGEYGWELCSAGYDPTAGHVAWMKRPHESSQIDSQAVTK